MGLTWSRGLGPLAILLLVCGCAAPAPPAPTATPAPTSAPAAAASVSAVASPSPSAAVSGVTPVVRPSGSPAASPAVSPAASPGASPAASPSAVAKPAAAGAPAAAAPAPAGSAAHGEQLFVSVGCYACHGTVGQGASTGPRLAPNPIDFAAFQQQVRQPRQDMPRFAPQFLSDADLADIYAYLQSIPAGPSPTSVPLLNP